MIRTGSASVAVPTLPAGRPQADPAVRARWAEVRGELERIRALGDDWDGAGSPAPDGALVAAAARWALGCSVGGEPPADRVILGVNGTVIFEWHGPDHYVEVEVVSPHAAERRWVNLKTRASEADGIALH